MLLVVTITCERLKIWSTSSMVAGIWWRVQTIGHLASARRTIDPRALRIPRERNLSASCVRRASAGTTTRSLGQGAETRMDSIVSVFPVPVGITMVAGASDTDQ